jgi:hypothetical protein
MPRWIIALLIAALGFAAGLSYGRFIAPVEYVDTIPASLRIDYRTDFVLMVAERFHADHDSESARRQLSILGAESPAASCTEAISFARLSAYADRDLQLLEELDRAMQVLVPGATATGDMP